MKSIDKFGWSKLVGSNNSLHTIENIFYKLKLIDTDGLSFYDVMYCEFSQKILIIKC
ncbi:MAG: hypothetical protein K0R14_1963 [Burkholderiales bacterium]|jgi:hypothetical protein|nr:hypothetical protein [Burkholderiales bacterium]